MPILRAGEGRALAIAANGNKKSVVNIFSLNLNPDNKFPLEKWKHI